MSEKVDITVFGCTGFTGQRVASYLINKLKEGKEKFTLALAGRREKQIKDILSSFSGVEDIGIFIADVEIESSIVNMCQKSKTIISCVGPFQRFGEVVVKHCVAFGTNYVDITGEPLFIDNMIYKYGEAAKDKGCTIVPACGFDSVPADMGVLFNLKQFRDPTFCSSVESYLQIYAKNGFTINFGTLDSLIDGFTNFQKLVQLRKSMKRPAIKYYGPPLKRSNWPQYHKMLGLYYVTFPGSDASVVRNTQFFFQDMKEHSYPTPIQYSALLGISNFFYMTIFFAFGFILSLMIKLKIGRMLLRKYPEIFTLGYFTKSGPSEVQMKGSSFTTTFIGQGYKEKSEKPGKPDLRVITKVTGPEIGYVTTPICVCEAAITLLLEKKKFNSFRCFESCCCILQDQVYRETARKWS